MSGDNVSTTGSDGRKQTSKPVMEKRRRARINACLVELKSLLMEVIKSEGTRQSKMEKADILEMTVRHLRQLQRQSLTGVRSIDPANPNKYRLGYTECINEVSRFLGSLDLDEVELRTKIIDHLANCVCSSRFYDDDVTSTISAFPYNTAVVKPRIETQSSSDKPSTSVRSNSTHLPIAPKPEIRTETTRQFVLDISHTGISQEPTTHIFPSDITVPRISASCSKDSEEIQTALNLVTCSVPSTVSNTYTPLQIPIPGHPVASQLSGMCNIKEPEPSSENTSQLQFIKPIQAIEQTYQSNQSVQPLSSFTSSSVFSGFQIVPTKLPSGELAFVLPTNILPSTPTPSYIIPVFSQNIPAADGRSQPQTQPQTLGSMETIPVMQQRVLPISGIRPLILNSVPSNLQTLTSSVQVQKTPSPERFEVPSGSNVADTATSSKEFKANTYRIHLPHTLHDINNNNNTSLEHKSVNLRTRKRSVGTSPRDELSHFSRTETGSGLKAEATGTAQCDTINWSPVVSYAQGTGERSLQPGSSLSDTMGSNSLQIVPNLNIPYTDQVDNDVRNTSTNNARQMACDQNNHAPGRQDDRDEDMWRPW